jgi:pyruvate dehydrogenase E2 component (dihydrolipoamide acetyltransferase)
VSQQTRSEAGRPLTLSPSRPLVPSPPLVPDVPYALTAIEVDLGRVAAALAARGAKFARRGLALTQTTCIALVTVGALAHHPLLNSAWTEGGLIVRRRVCLMVSGAAGAALVRDAQDLNLRGLARALGLSVTAPRLDRADTPTFTLVANTGDAWLVTPASSQPHAAALAWGAVRRRPLVVSEHGIDRIVVRPAALFTLTYDARALDQRHADAFLREVKRGLEQFEG